MIEYLDIESDSGGDIVLGDNGDFKIASSARSTAQVIQFRIQTETGDFAPDLEFGAGLDIVAGEPNSIRSHNRLMERARISLTRDGVFSDPSLSIIVTAIGLNDVAMFILINDSIKDFTGTLQLSLMIDYIQGTIKRITDNS